MNWGLYIIPFLAAFLGYITNWVAIKMLFHPRKPINLGFYRLHGVFPKRQASIALKIGKMVAEQLLSVTDIKNKIDAEELATIIQRKVEERMDEYLEHQLPEKYPLVSLFVGERAKTSVKREVLNEISNSTPVLMDDLIEDLESKINIEQMIREKVALLSPIKLEELIMSILKKEFFFIELIGALIGFLVGLLQLLLYLYL